MESHFDWPQALSDVQRKQCEEFTHWLLRECDSYGRIGAILEADLEPPVFYAVLGQEWSMCDNIAQYAATLRPKLSKASRAELDLMMSDDEFSEWKKLPTTVRAYRFAYDNNLSGFSYSLSREVAESFHGKIRYVQAENPNRFLITADILKRWIVLKRDRQEAEIIVAKRSALKRIRKDHLK